MVKRKKKVGDNPEIDAHLKRLVAQRERAQAALAHLRFVEDNFVESALVEKALDLGLSQDEVADQFGMSKRDVNRLANLMIRADAPPAAAPAFDMLRATFLETLSGSRTTAQAIERDCVEFDGERRVPGPAEGWSPEVQDLLGDRQSALACTRCNDDRSRQPILQWEDLDTVADLLATALIHGDLPQHHGPHRASVIGGFRAKAHGDKVTVTISMPEALEQFPDKIYEFSVRAISTGFPPPATPPAVGGLVGSGRHDRGKSEELAKNWTTQLALLAERDEVANSSGLVVGVGQDRDEEGRWNLVWTEPSSEAGSQHA